MAQNTVSFEPSWRTQLQRVRWIIFFGGWLALANADGAQDGGAPRLALRAGDLDAVNCAAFESGRPLADTPPVAVLEGLLGLRRVAVTNVWSTPPLAGEIRRFRLAFRQPVAAGTLCTEYEEEGAVAVLKADAPFPGDVNDDAQWLALPFGSVKLLPENTPVRALRFTHRVHNQAWEDGRHASTLRCALLLAGRYWNPAQLGGGEWRRDAKSDEVWFGFWPMALPIAGVALASQPGGEARLAAAPADNDTHPAVLAAA